MNVGVGVVYIYMMVSLHIPPPLVSSRSLSHLPSPLSSGRAVYDAVVIYLNWTPPECFVNLWPPYQGRDEPPTSHFAIATDGGANRLYYDLAPVMARRLGITIDAARARLAPQVIAGDFDSLHIDVETYYRKKGTAIRKDPGQVTPTHTHTHTHTHPHPTWSNELNSSLRNPHRNPATEPLVPEPPHLNPAPLTLPP